MSDKKRSGEFETKIFETTPEPTRRKPSDRRNENLRNENLRTDVGGFWETLAVEHLEKAGFHIIERNWTARAAEIDVVAHDCMGTVWFFEVKFRRQKSTGTAVESFTTKKRRDFFRAVSLYCFRFGLDFDRTRAGLIAIDRTESGYRITRYSNLSIEG